MPFSYDTFGFHSISQIAYSKMMVRLINNFAYWQQLVQQFFPPLVRKPGRPHLKRNDNLRKFVQSEFQPTFWSEFVRPRLKIYFDFCQSFCSRQFAIERFAFVFIFPVPAADRDHTRASEVQKTKEEKKHTFLI